MHKFSNVEELVNKFFNAYCMLSSKERVRNLKQLSWNMRLLYTTYDTKGFRVRFSTGAGVLDSIRTFVIIL